MAEAILVSVREGAFLVAPKLWNSYPREVCLVPSLHAFRRYVRVNYTVGLLILLSDVLYFIH